MPRHVLPARAWRARAMIAAGALLVPLGAHVVSLERAWGERDICLVRAAPVVEEYGGYRVRLGIDVSQPYCRFDIDGSPRLATKEEADRRAAAFPVGGTIPCHRPPGMCGAAVVSAHVAAPFWLLPIGSLALLAAGVATLRWRSASAPRPAPAVAGPFRAAPPPEEAPPREPLVLSLPGDGLLVRLLVSFMLLAPSVLGAPVIWWAFWKETLDTIGFPALVLGLALLTTASFAAGIVKLFGRHRLVVDGAGRFAFRGAGFGPLDVMRVYASFDRWPDASIKPVKAVGRGGYRYVVGYTLVLTDGRTSLRAGSFSHAEKDKAKAAVRRIKAHRRG